MAGTGRQTERVALHKHGTLAQCHAEVQIEELRDNMMSQLLYARHLWPTHHARSIE